MIDVQNSTSTLPIEVNKVGIKDLIHPVDVEISHNEKIKTVATFNMYVSLDQNQRGAHMSRFVEILNQQNWKLSIAGLKELLQVTKERHLAKNSFIQTSFHIFLQKQAPVSNSCGLVNYQVNLNGKIINDKTTIECCIKIPITTLCPCSKEISNYGAHNQRTFIIINFTPKENIYFKDIITQCEKSASCEIYSILKRSDEKFVSESAYNNPKFVEDIAREIANKFNKDKRFINYKVEVESLESIHNHSAYASIEG